MTYNKGKGRGLEWLKAHVSHTGSECLIWPMSRLYTGYGQLGYFGKVRKAHNIMCRLAHGEPPSPNHHAAHSCGNGHLGCVHPQHLSWKTPTENRLDSSAHGRPNKWKGPKMTFEIAQKIRESTKSYSEIAAEFGINYGRVGKIKRGETWNLTT